MQNKTRYQSKLDESFINGFFDDISSFYRESLKQELNSYINKLNVYEKNYYDSLIDEAEKLKEQNLSLNEKLEILFDKFNVIEKYSLDLIKLIKR